MSTAPASQLEWDARQVVARAGSAAQGGKAANEAGVHLLKRGPRSEVVWIDAGGPNGEPVVVKSFAPDSPWRTLGQRGRSTAQVQSDAAALLATAGVEAVEVIAEVEEGPERPSHLICRAVVGADVLDELLRRLDWRGRRRLARALGAYVARLHTLRVYAPDLKYENLLVRRTDDGGFRFVLVDLDRVRRPTGGVSWRRRQRNLIQLYWGLGWWATPRERLALVAAYRRALPDPRPRLKTLVEGLEQGRRRKFRRLLRRRRRAGSRPSERVPISCMVICQNEAPRIRECLESVKWCDEIVVIDGMSTDGTDAICREYTSRVFQRPWPGHRAQKQFALDQTTLPWVLNVDADERVSPDLREEIEMMLAHDGAGFDGFQIARLVHYLGRWWWRGGWYPSRRLRLFRREVTEWGGTDPHEKAVVHGKIGRLRAPLYHFTYQDVAHHVTTMDRLTDVAAREHPRPGSWNRLLLRPLARFVRSYVLRGGFREGLPGLFVAVSGAFYVHVKYAKSDAEWRAGARRGSAKAG